MVLGNNKIDGNNLICRIKCFFFFEKMFKMVQNAKKKKRVEKPATYHTLSIMSFAAHFDLTKIKYEYLDGFSY